MKLVYNEDKETEKQKNIENHTILEEDNVRKAGKVQRAKLKGKPFKEKVAYFVEYYKYPVLAVVIGGIILYSLIASIASNKDYCFSGMMINSVMIDSNEISDSFGEYAELDLDNYSCYIDCGSVMSITGFGEQDLASSTRFIAMIQSQDLDIVTLDSTNFYTQALGESMIDLTTVLSKEDLEKHKDRLYYIDYADIEKADETIGEPSGSLYNQIDTIEELRADLETHRHPENMEKPVLVGIIIEDAPLIKETQSYSGLIPVFGIIGNSPRMDAAVKFLQYMYDENVDFSKLTATTVN